MRCGVFAQQVPDVRPLMDSVFQKETGLFVEVHPFSVVWLEEGDTMDYRLLLKDHHFEIDHALLIELIRHCAHPDTTSWTQEEVKKHILVDSSDDYISPKKVIREWGLVDKDAIEKLRRAIRRYNDPGPYDRYIYHVSRPVIDQTGSYAVVCEGFSWGPGEEKVYSSSALLFHFDGQFWNKIGDLERVVY